MPDITNATRIWIVTQFAARPIVALGILGKEVIEPAPILSPCGYIEASRGRDTTYAAGVLMGPSAQLIVTIPSPDGAPNRVGLVFSRLRDGDISYEHRGRSFLGHMATEYVAAGVQGGYLWDVDRSNRAYGSFLIGSTEESSLWKVRRMEVDYLGRLLFTLRSEKPLADFPTPDFSSITDETVRLGAIENWESMVDALAGNRIPAAITAAKQVAEHVLYFYLWSSGYIQPGFSGLDTLLEKLGKLLRDEKIRSVLAFKDLDYHLMHKIRVLHGRTHIGRQIMEGRTVSSEYGLTVALDLVEVLTSFGLVR